MSLGYLVCLVAHGRLPVTPIYDQNLDLTQNSRLRRLRVGAHCTLAYIDWFEYLLTHLPSANAVRCIIVDLLVDDRHARYIIGWNRIDQFLATPRFEALRSFSIVLKDNFASTVQPVDIVTQMPLSANRGILNILREG